MNEFVRLENIKIENETFEFKIKEFKKANDKKELIKKYRNHNMRFSLIIIKNIALEKNEIEFANFINDIILDITKQISILNNAFKLNTLDITLKDYSLNEKVNIIFFVRPEYYDKKYDEYEILKSEVFELLSQSIIEDANNILKKYNCTLDDIKFMNINDIHKLIDDNELVVDILYAKELIS